MRNPTSTQAVSPPEKSTAIRLIHCIKFDAIWLETQMASEFRALFAPAKGLI